MVKKTKQTPYPCIVWLFTASSLFLMDQTGQKSQDKPRKPLHFWPFVEWKTWSRGDKWQRFLRFFFPPALLSFSAQAGFFLVFITFTILPVLVFKKIQVQVLSNSLIYCQRLILLHYFFFFCRKSQVSDKYLFLNLFFLIPI